MFNTPHMESAEVLRILRTNLPLIIKHKRYTYVEICKDAGISYRALRKFLNGETDMAVGTLVRVLAAADTTLIGIMRWKA